VERVGTDICVLAEWASSPTAFRYVVATDQVVLVALIR
jgi:hypothetical protein